ncbi:MAG: inositol monophosphatase family protein [Planctomycetota bacterium]
MSPDYLRVAEDAAREAGEVLLGYLGRISAESIGRKSSFRDLVTEADVESERLLVARLREAFPDHAIEAEEEVRDAADDRPRWFLDPLDGTINFVHQLPCFAVSMGLFVDGRPEAAVVHAPRLGETFTARRGGGAYLNGEAIRVSAATELSESILATGFPYRRGELEHDNLANFNRFFYDARGMRRLGSAAIDLAYTAAGRFDGFWELHLSPHDVAAGALLVREAGGLVTDGDGGENWLRGDSLVAGPEPIHRALVQRVEH